MAHRRSRSQRIGTQGEHLFAAWAARVGLSANKTEQDLGIDFHCEVMRRDEDGHETATGQTIAVWVRATNTIIKPRVKVDRDDAARMLECGMPVCLIGVNTKTQEIAWKLLDVSMQSELRKFLASPQKQHSWLLESMSCTGDALHKQLSHLLRPVVQRKLAHERIVHSLEQRFGRADFSIYEGSAGTDAVLRVPWAGRAIDASNASVSALRTALSEVNSLPVPGTHGFELHPTVEKFFSDHADRIGLVQGSGFSVESVRVRADGRESQLFMQRRIVDDWLSNTHPIGVCFAVTAAREKNGQWVHEVDFFLHRADGHSLSQSSAERDFLRLLRPGAELKFGDGPWQDIERWDNATGIGSAIDAFEQVSSRTQVPLDNAFLADLDSERTAASLYVLEALLIRNLTLDTIYPGFVIENAAEDSSRITQGKLGNAHVPVITDFAGHIIVVWCLVEVVGHFYDGVIIGASFMNQQRLELEIVEGGEYLVAPGIYLFDGWPALPIPTSNEQITDGMMLAFGGSLPLSAHFETRESGGG